jgi:hypothetical protein
MSGNLSAPPKTNAMPTIKAQFQQIGLDYCGPAGQGGG